MPWFRMSNTRPRLNFLILWLTIFLSQICSFFYAGIQLMLERNYSRDQRHYILSKWTKKQLLDVAPLLLYSLQETNAISNRTSSVFSLCSFLAIQLYSHLMYDAESHTLMAHQLTGDYLTSTTLNHHSVGTSLPLLPPPPSINPA